MEHHERELLVARVASGSVRLTLPDGRRFVVRRPGRDDVYGAHLAYADALERAAEEGLYTEAEAVALLREDGTWSEKEEKLFSDLPEQIDELKVELYKAVFKSDKRKSLRKAISLARDKFAELAEKRGSLAHLTRPGVAAMARTRFLVGCGLFTPSGEKVFSAGVWDEESALLEAVLRAYAAERPGEAELREVARTEPWRSTWGAHKSAGSVFGVPACDHTDEQRLLVNWSALYDGVFQHPNCPPDEVVADDDTLDGWMIVQRRERGGDGADPVPGSDQVKRHAQVFVPADSTDDARRVMDLNDAAGKIIAKQRFDHLQKKGEVNELDMPDTALRLRTAIVNKG